MQKITLSIIVPVYNVEQYLHDCLDSILQIKSISWEAILIDDGSTDSSGCICDKYAAVESRFRVIHQSNAGVSAARNAGLIIARGEWIWFVDSDDIINPIPESVSFKRIEKADYVLFDKRDFIDVQSVTGKSQPTILFYDEGISKNDFLCKYICYHHQQIFYRKDTLYDGKSLRLSFSEGIRVGEDLEFQYKYLTLCKHPIKLNAILYNYRLREGSATQDNYREKNVADLPKVLDNLLKWFSEGSVKPEPWIENRIYLIFQNLLYSASLLKIVDRQNLQIRVRTLLKSYGKCGFLFTNNVKMQIAFFSIRLYSALNKIYLQIKKK